MASFAERQNKEVVLWEKELSKKNISVERWKELKNLAGSWSTCGVGQCSHLIPRDSERRPIDASLDALGMSFTAEIDKKDAEIALIYLKRIKAKEKEILKEVFTQKQQEVTELKEELKN